MIKTRGCCISFSLKMNSKFETISHKKKKKEKVVEKQYMTLYKIVLNRLLRKENVKNKLLMRQLLFICYN